MAEDEKTMDDPDIVADLQKFMDDNPVLTEELDLLGMTITEYETTLAKMHPVVVTASNTTI